MAGERAGGMVANSWCIKASNNSNFTNSRKYVCVLFGNNQQFQHIFRLSIDSDIVTEKTFLIQARTNVYDEHSKYI